MGKNLALLALRRVGFVRRGKAKCAKCAAGKKKLKMRVGKILKTFGSALSVGSLVCVNLLKNCPVKVRLIVRLQSLGFSVVTVRVALSFYAWA